MKRDFNELANRTGEALSLAKGQFIVQESSLMHSVELTNVGGMVKLNDATTDRIIGISDFTGTLLPVDQTGILYAVRFGYAKQTSIVAGTAPKKTVDNQDFQFYNASNANVAGVPAWLLNSELVFKYNGVEAFRMRVEEIMCQAVKDCVPSECAKELMRPLTIEGGKNFEMFLDTSKNGDITSAADDAEFVKIVLYCTKVVSRKIA